MTNKTLTLLPGFEQAPTGLDEGILITEVDLENENRHTRYFWVDVDNGKDFCRRGRQSFNAFAHNWRKCRNLRPNRRKPRFLYHCQEISLDCPIVISIHAERHYSLTLWQFYDLIDYDYRTKKYRS